MDSFLDFHYRFTIRNSDRVWFSRSIPIWNLFYFFYHSNRHNGNNVLSFRYCASCVKCYEAWPQKICMANNKVKPNCCITFVLFTCLLFKRDYAVDRQRVRRRNVVLTNSTIISISDRSGGRYKCISLFIWQLQAGSCHWSCYESTTHCLVLYSCSNLW